MLWFNFIHESKKGGILKFQYILFCGSTQIFNKKNKE